MGDQGIAAWKLPLIVGGIAVSIIGGFYLGGPGLGMAVGAFAAATIIVMGVRKPPLQPIVPAPSPDLRGHLLVVVDEPLEESTAIELIAAASEPRGRDDPEPEVLVIAPTRNGFLDRWASDTRAGRERAQRSLVLSLACLAQAGVGASAGIADEDVVQAVTDQLREYPATEVFLVAGSRTSREAAAELRSRLRVPFHLLEGRPPAAQSASSTSTQTSSIRRSQAASTSRAQ